MENILLQPETVWDFDTNLLVHELLRRHTESTINKFVNIDRSDFEINDGLMIFLHRKMQEMGVVSHLNQVSYSNKDVKGDFLILDCGGEIWSFFGNKGAEKAFAFKSLTHDDDVQCGLFEEVENDDFKYEIAKDLLYIEEKRKRLHVSYEKVDLKNTMIATQGIFKEFIPFKCNENVLKDSSFIDFLKSNENIYTSPHAHYSDVEPLNKLVGIVQDLKEALDVMSDERNSFVDLNVTVEAPVFKALCQLQESLLSKAELLCESGSNKKERFFMLASNALMSFDVPVEREDQQKAWMDLIGGSFFVNSLHMTQWDRHSNRSYHLSSWVRFATYGLSKNTIGEDRRSFICNKTTPDFLRFNERTRAVVEFIEKVEKKILIENEMSSSKDFKPPFSKRF